MNPSIFPYSGGFEQLVSYQKALIVFDGTVAFCRAFLAKDPRTADQMIQAARSGKQNIAEGSMASATSKESEIFLTNVGKSSLGELRLDYQDYLRVNGFEQWPPEHKFAKRLYELNRIRGATYQTFQLGLEHEDPVIRANVLLGITENCIWLLERQLKSLEKQFLAEGGLRERMSRARKAAREDQSQL